MDTGTSSSSKQELDYLVTQMKNMHATQVELHDRMMRLEQRQDGESRVRSVWAGQSPYTTPTHGTPQHGPSTNLAAEAFKMFDQDQSGSMLGSLHLDADDEPRRGASRANSVRFDESAIHGHVGLSSRSQSDFFHPRSISQLSGHPLVERSASHKSEGRASSTHSARGSSVGESRTLSATVPAFVPSAVVNGPPAGLFIIGPVPSIIRCWLDTNYSNESLLYAAICTASYHSTISFRLIEQLDLVDQITVGDDGREKIKLPVYLPEASIKQASTVSGSSTPQLPTLTTEFTLQTSTSSAECIDIFLGCDLLRFRNADIHFSLDRLTLFDDERNKVSVPLVRPENASIFRHLQTTVLESITPGHHNAITERSSGDAGPQQSETGNTFSSTTAISKSPSRNSRARSPLQASSVETTGQDSTNTHIGAQSRAEPVVAQSWRRTTDSDEKTSQSIGDLSVSSQRDQLGSTTTSTSSFPAFSYQKAGTTSSGFANNRGGRGMKILKPSRSSVEFQNGSNNGYSTSAMRGQSEGTWRSAGSGQGSGRMVEASDTTKQSGLMSPTTPISAKNPVGGASAFGWLNSTKS